MLSAPASWREQADPAQQGTCICYLELPCLTDSAMRRWCMQNSAAAKIIVWACRPMDMWTRQRSSTGG